MDARPIGGERYRAWRAVRHVLAVRLDALGDVLMTTPALRAARCSHPERRLTLLTSPAGAEAARLVPDVDDVIVYDAPWVKATGRRTSAQPDRHMIRRLAARRFDAAVIFTVHSQNPLPAALMCYLADVPLRLAHCRENPYQLLTDWVRDPEPNERRRHEVERQLDLVASVGWRAPDARLRLEVPEAAKASVRRAMRELGLSVGTPWAVIHPGATAPSRRYPAKHFARVVHALAAEHGWRLVLTGSSAERDLAERLAREGYGAAVSLAGRLSLAELAALIAEAPLLISNNTGPVHIAAAVGTPVVDLYALTNLQHTPWRVPSRVLYRDVPCRCCYRSVCPEGHHACLEGVSPERVVEAACELLAASKEGSVRTTVDAVAARRVCAQRHDIRDRRGDSDDADEVAAEGGP